MDRALWLPDVLSDAGLKVWLSPGWETRGRALPTIHGVVGHHTATGTNWTDTAVEALLRLGRRDLAGPLSQLGLERDGTYVVVAAGRANHNGYGLWGNSAIGIEAYNKGDGIDPWPADQVDAYERGAAAILRHLGRGADRFLGHRETDPKRKIDPRGLDLDVMRRRIAWHISTPHREDFTMDDEARAAFAALNRRLDAQDRRFNDVIGSVWSDEATDVAHQAEGVRHYNSLRGWVAAIAEKLGVTREDAMAHDLTHRK